MMMRRSEGIEPQVIALSAVIGDTNGLERWLGGRLLRRMERPVPRAGASHLTSARTHRSVRASALQTWRDVKIARVGRNGRRRETARLRLLAMRKFDP